MNQVRGLWYGDLTGKKARSFPSDGSLFLESVVGRKIKHPIGVLSAKRGMRIEDTEDNRTHKYLGKGVWQSEASGAKYRQEHFDDIIRVGALRFVI